MRVPYTLMGGWTFSQNFSSLALTVCVLWYYEDLVQEEKADSLSEWMNDKAVYRKAPATPGLLIIHQLLAKRMTVKFNQYYTKKKQKKNGVGPIDNRPST